MIRTKSRSGFTLIELLVAMAIIAALAAMAAMVSMAARDQDRVRNGVSEVTATLKLAQAMAARDQRPRGVRFICALDSNNSDKEDPRFCTEMQYIEMPPPLIPNPKPLSNTNSIANYDPNLEARVRFFYTESTGTGAAPNNQPRGTIIGRECQFQNLTAEQADAIVPGCTLVMPVFGAWHRIIAVNARTAISPAAPAPYPALFNKIVTLEVYPDANMGAGTQIYIHHFAIYRVASPLLGEPTVLIPHEVCVDLSISAPYTPSSAAPPDFDVLFAPNGQMILPTNGQTFLWIRNYTNGTMPSTNGNLNPGLPLVDAFKKGGEQHILTIRKSGALGSSMAMWPDTATGNYAPGQNAFTLARQELNQ